MATFLQRGRGDVLVKAGVFLIGADQAEVLKHRHDKATGIDGLAGMQRVEGLGRQFGRTFHDGINVLGRSPAIEPHALAAVSDDAQVQLAGFLWRPMA
jgi:hypothetical protein